MTKKHFIQFARILGQAYARCEEIKYPFQKPVEGVDFVTDALTNYFITLNPLFDEKRFRAAIIEERDKEARRWQ